MKTILAACMVLVVLTHARAEIKYCITSRYQGNVYESCVTDEQFNKVPTWAPFDQEQAPVSPEKALLLARTIFEKHVSETERSNWTLTGLNLKHLHDYAGPTKEYAILREKWFYLAHFWNNTNPVVAGYPTPRDIAEKQDEFYIIVLMSGEACDPIPRNNEQNSEQAGPAYPPQGVGSADP